MIISNCKSIVTQSLEYQRLGIHGIDLAAQHLWNFVYDMLDTVLSQHVVVKWVPGHLDANENVVKRNKNLADGLDTMQGISGSVTADALADTGTRGHMIDPDIFIETEDRLLLTQAVQNHLFASWSLWVHHTKVEGCDIQDVDFQCAADDGYNNHIDELHCDAYAELYEEFKDSEPFGHIDINGQDIGHPQVDELLNAYDDEPTWAEQSTGMAVAIPVALSYQVKYLRAKYQIRRWKASDNGTSLVFQDVCDESDTKTPVGSNPAEANVVYWWLEETQFS